MKTVTLFRLAASLLMIVAPPVIYFFVVKPSLASSTEPESVDLFAKVLGLILMLLGVITAPIWFIALIRGKDRSG